MKKTIIVYQQLSAVGIGLWLGCFFFFLQAGKEKRKRKSIWNHTVWSCLVSVESSRTHEAGNSCFTNSKTLYGRQIDRYKWQTSTDLLTICTQLEQHSSTQQTALSATAIRQLQKSVKSNTQKQCANLHTARFTRFPPVSPFEEKSNNIAFSF